MFYPSLIAHIFGAFLLLISVYMILTNIKTITTRSSYDIIILLLLISGVVTLHGISHLGLEYIYGFNPLSIQNV